MTANYNETVKNMSDEELTQAARDVLEVKRTGILPEGPARKLQLEIANILGHSQSQSIAINMIKEEVLKRYAKL